MSKDIKPKIRIGQKRSLKSKIAGWTVITLVCGGAAVAAYRLTGTTEVDVPAAKVRRADFVISVRARGEIKSTRSVILTAPQVPDTRIVKLIESGRPVRKGEVVVEFDAAQQDAGAPESFKPEHGPSSTLDCPVILFDYVVQILVLADLDRRVALGVQILKRGQI